MIVMTLGRFIEIDVENRKIVKYSSLFNFAPFSIQSSFRNVALSSSFHAEVGVFPHIFFCDASEFELIIIG